MSAFDIISKILDLIKDWIDYTYPKSNYSHHFMKDQLSPEFFVVILELIHMGKVIFQKVISKKDIQCSIYQLIMNIFET